MFAELGQGLLSLERCSRGTLRAGVHPAQPSAMRPRRRVLFAAGVIALHRMGLAGHRSHRAPAAHAPHPRHRQRLALRPLLRRRRRVPAQIQPFRPAALPVPRSTRPPASGPLPGPPPGPPHGPPPGPPSPAVSLDSAVPRLPAVHLCMAGPQDTKLTIRPTPCGCGGGEQGCGRGCGRATRAGRSA